MKFCTDCGSMLPAGSDHGACPNCGTEYGDPDAAEPDGGREQGQGESPSTELEKLPTTKSGSVKKADAMEWLKSREKPSNGEIRRVVTEKPSDFEGSTYPTDISNIRLTGSPEFIETIAGLFAWIVDMEDYSRRVEINLKETEDRETGEKTGNYALYLSVAERGG